MSAPKRRAWLSRLVGEGENPLMWSLPLVALRGLRVRIHTVFLVWIVLRLVRSIPEDNRGVLYEAGFLGAVLLLVLGQQAVSAAVQRRAADPDAEEQPIVIWPLGGLLPPVGARSRWTASLGVIGFHAVLAPVLALGTFLFTRDWGLVIYSPAAAAETEFLVLAGSGGVIAWVVWTLHSINAVLLSVHLLVPMLPLAAAGIVGRSIDRGSARGSDQVVPVLGMACAFLIAAAGWWLEEIALFGIALVGMAVCYQEQRRLAFLANLSSGDDLFAIEADDGPPDQPTDAPSGPADDTPDAEAIDRILGKISADGLESLSDAERRALEAASARTRQK